jgi:hypothetical protein
MISQYFTGGIMPESANPVQQGVTLIESAVQRRLAVLRGVPVSNPTGPATRRERTQSVTPLRAQNSDAAKFALIRLA